MEDTGSVSLKSTVALFPKRMRFADAVSFSDKQGGSGVVLRGVVWGGVFDASSITVESGVDWFMIFCALSPQPQYYVQLADIHGFAVNFLVLTKRFSFHVENGAYGVGNRT